MNHECANGHELRGPLDTFDDGRCRRCDKTYGATYRTRRRAAVELAQYLEAEGIAVMRTEPPIDLAMLAKALANGFDSTAT